jgi:mono/diheme cytochrome c family protein
MCCRECAGGTAGVSWQTGAAAAALLLLVAACATVVTGTGDAARGRGVVEKWCSLCHDVGGNRARATAPAFAEIVRKPGRDAAYLRDFIDDDHFPMTMHRLFEQERNDVLAYLVSLRGRPGETR